MKKKLLLITKRFPFGEFERSFLGTEFQRLTEEFEVSVWPMMGKDIPLIYPFPSEIPLMCFSANEPVRQDPKALLWLLTVPFRPYVIREVLRASWGCSVKTALQRTRQILSCGLGAWRCMPFLRRIAEENKVDLIYTYWCNYTTLAAVRLKKRFSQLKVITRFHGYDLFRERIPDGWQPFRLEISYGCDRLFFVSEMGRKYYLETWGERWAAKSFVSYLGSRDLSPHPPPPQHPGPESRLMLVSCSNMLSLKRVHLIIDALALLPEEVSVCWYHIGDGGECCAAVREQAENTLSPLPNVRWKFWGYVPNGELDSLYQDVQPDVFITTSSTEGGVPVSIQEVFSIGVPAIATAVGGIPEIVRDGETGFLLSADPSAQEIANAVLRFYELTTLEKEAMGKAARALWVEKFDAGKNTADFVQRLKHLLSK